MKAVVWTEYGPPEVLQLQEVAKPEPRDHEVQIKIHATTVSMGDCEMRSLRFPLFLSLPLRVFMGLRKPQRVNILGQELAGEIEVVGKGVTHFKEGDSVFAATGFHLGAYAQYTCLPETGALTIKPANLTFEEAAAVPLGGLEALYFLRKAAIRPGEKVLIVGAGGSIGTIGIQLARHFGAGVTAVDSAAKLDLLRSLGAEQVLDYTREDFTQGGEQFDVIYDVIGKNSIGRGLRALKPKGRYLAANPGFAQMVRGPWTSRVGNKQVISGAASQRAEDLDFLRELIEAGKVKPVIDRCYPLDQAAETHRYVETGQKQGSVVLTVGHP